MSLTIQIKKVTRVLAVFVFTLLEILGLPRIPGEKAKKGSKTV